MAKNISLLGADYPDVPAVQLPKTGGGTATFVDADEYQNVVYAGDLKQKNVTLVANGVSDPVFDNSYQLQGKTYIGTLVYSFGGHNVNISTAYAGMSLGIGFYVRNNENSTGTMTVNYRHLYI